jgi:hypothetical protein
MALEGKIWGVKAGLLHFAALPRVPIGADFGAYALATKPLVTDWIIAVGTVIAAVGTVAAVSLALYEARRSERAHLHVVASFVIEGVGGGRRGRSVIRLVGTNHGPAPIRIVDAHLAFKAASGTIIGVMRARGDLLAKVLNVGETVTAEWDEDVIELARTESNGEPYTHVSFIDAFGQEHSAPFPGMTEKRRGRWLRRVRRLPREFVPVKPPS